MNSTGSISFDVVSLTRELNELTCSDGMGTTYAAAIERAHKECHAEKLDLMLGHIKAVIADTYLDMGVGKAEIKSKSSDKYKQAIDNYITASLEAKIAKAEHERLLNRMEAIRALLIVEQTQMKYLK